MPRRGVKHGKTGAAPTYPDAVAKKQLLVLPNRAAEELQFLKQRLHILEVSWVL